MSITTRFGDQGSSRLYSGQTISKRSKRIVVCGLIDELVSHLGVAYAFVDNKYDNTFAVAGRELAAFLKDEITYIQRTLFTVASEIATLEPKLSQLPNRIDYLEMKSLDDHRDLLESKIELPKGFILPGVKQISAQLDVCRTVCRRCEPPIVELYEEGFICNTKILMWMNRLSDYLYLMARYSENNVYRMVK